MRKPLTIGTGLLTVTSLTMFPGLAHAERCSDGTRTTDPKNHDSHHAQAEDEDCIERDIFLMPGGQAVFFHPTAGKGYFFGGGVQFAPYQFSHNNDHFGPSQVSTIAQVSLLKSADANGTMALFELGATASLERNSSRRWMIPYFGGTIGGMTQSDLGTSAYAYTMGGVHLYWHHNLMVDAEGGYHFPFQDIDHLKGPRAQLSTRFSLW